jgi:hypothetical protein
MDKRKVEDKGREDPVAADEMLTSNLVQKAVLVKDKAVVVVVEEIDKEKD